MHGRIPIIGQPIRGGWRSQLAKASAEDETRYRWLHRIADGAAPKVRDEFLAAVEQVRNSVKAKALESALDRQDIEEVLRILDITGNMQAALQPQFIPALEDTYIAAGRAAPRPGGGKLGMRFDLTNPRSIRFLQEYDFGLIRQVSDETRHAVRQVVLDAFETGGHPYEQARQIKQFIGLTERQAQTVMNYRDMLESEDHSADAIDQLTERFHNRMLRSRATNIARTETMRAANAGANEAVHQAVEEGLLDRQTTRIGWMVTPDDRLCPLCEAIPDMNPDGVPVGGYFQTPDGPIKEPPLHPQCRCVPYTMAL